VIRGTRAVVDDVWALVGSSSFSRRGLTFDGSIDVVLVDKQIRNGVSAAIRDLRRQAMARTLGLAPPADGETANPNWVRLRPLQKAFELVKEITERGGDGLVEPLWPGLPETEILPADQAIADPEGRGFAAVLGAFAALLADLGQSRV
jgi:predicted xylose isomerase-like sugar epimerase